MKTRDKILETARELFNNDGVSTVSSRNISDAMNISYGNLCYHFPKKDDIIMQLYASMQTELDTEVAKFYLESATKKFLGKGRGPLTRSGDQ